MTWLIFLEPEEAGPGANWCVLWADEKLLSRAVTLDEIAFNKEKKP